MYALSFDMNIADLREHYGDMEPILILSARW